VKKTITKTLSIILIFNLLFFTSCKKQENDADYTLSIGKTMNIELEGNWSTGYFWYWENNNAITIVDTLRREYVAAPGIGRAGKEIWTFIAIKKGSEKLVFAYKRTSETTHESKKEFFITIR